MRSLSPVIAVVLLALITIAAAGSFFTWSEGLRMEQEKKGAELDIKISEGLGSSIEILDVRLSGGEYRVVVYNNGDKVLHGIRLFIDDRLDNANISVLSVNGIKEMNSSLLNSSGTGTYTLKVTTEEGARDTWRVKL